MGSNSPVQHSSGLIHHQGDSDDVSMIIQATSPTNTANTSRADTAESSRITTDHSHTNAGFEPDEDGNIDQDQSYSTSVTTIDSSSIPLDSRTNRYKSEKWYRTNLELAFPFLISGVGMVLTGYLLDMYINYLENFKALKELTVLVTPLLGLKGNLEMTLAARLCTLVSIGTLDTYQKKLHTSIGDLALSQVQAIVVGCLAAIVSILLLALEQGSTFSFNTSHILVIVSSSILTASLASLFLGVLMTIVVFSSEKCHVNPDNISTPIAAATGDLVTLNLLAWTSYWLYKEMESIWLPVVILFIYIAIIVFLGSFCFKNEQTKHTLIHCWVPLCTALGISSLAGLLFQYEDGRFYNMSLYQPVINGVGGNLVSIQYNRISTAYNMESELGKIPESGGPGSPTKVCLSLCDTYLRLGKHSTTAWVLVGITVPGHLIFAAITIGVSEDHKHICYQYFIILYLIACLLQVGILVWLAPILTNFLWKRKIDPDLYVIPLLTSAGDMMGTLLLSAVFESVYHGSCIGGRDLRSLPNKTTSSESYH